MLPHSFLNIKMSDYTMTVLNEIVALLSGLIPNKASDSLLFEIQKCIRTSRAKLPESI